MEERQNAGEGSAGPVMSQPAECQPAEFLSPSVCIGSWSPHCKHPGEALLSPIQALEGHYRCTLCPAGQAEPYMLGLWPGSWKTGQNLVYKAPVDIETSVIFATIHSRKLVLKYQINLLFNGLLWTIHL